MRYLPDTNILIAAFNAEDNVKSALNALNPEDEVLLSVVVWAELHFGALCSAKMDENLKRIKALCSTLPLVEISYKKAARFAVLKAELRKRGLSKSDLDLLIAASAIEENAVLVTDDNALLDNSVPGLVVQNWRR